MASGRQVAIAAVVATAVAAADQAVKALVIGSLALHDSVAVIPGCFEILHTRNTGVAFGLLAGGGARQRLLLAAISVAALALLAIMIRLSRPEETLGRTAFALVAGGAAGNLIDRLKDGYVTDYLEVFIGRHHWPTFNLADSAIVVGVALVILEALAQAARGHRR